MGHKEIILVNVTDAGENRLKSGLPLTKDAQIQRHIAERNRSLDGAPDNPGVRAVKSQRRDQSQTKSDHRPPDRKRFVFSEKFIEQRHVPRQQRVAEIEELDFFGRGIFGQ